MSTEEKIIQAAEKVFLRDGYDGARMKVIAEEAGLNKALLHYYFRSKENLFEKIAKAKMQEFLPTLGAVLFTDISLIEKLEHFIDRYLDLLSQNPYMPLFLINTVHKDPDFIRNLPKEFLQGFLGYFKLEINKGNIRNIDPRQFILSLIAMCIFPFVAKPIAKHMFDMEEGQYQQFLEDRRGELKTYVRTLLSN